MKEPTKEALKAFFDIVTTVLSFLFLTVAMIKFLEGDKVGTAYYGFFSPLGRSSLFRKRE